jgi:hypothetical protein
MATQTLEAEALLTPSGENQVIPPGKIQHRIEQRGGIKGYAVQARGFIQSVEVAPLDRPTDILFGAINDPGKQSDSVISERMGRLWCHLDLENWVWSDLSDLDDFGKTVLELFYSKQQAENLVLNLRESERLFRRTRRRPPVKVHEFETLVFKLGLGRQSRDRLAWFEYEGRVCWRPRSQGRAIFLSI